MQENIQNQITNDILHHVENYNTIDKDEIDQFISKTRPDTVPTKQYADKNEFSPK